MNALESRHLPSLLALAHVMEASALQEWAAGNRRRPPEYALVDRSGPDHAARFTVRVSVRNVGEAEAMASSKQEAETAAAKAFMERYG